MADFNDIIYIHPQRPVPKLSKGLAVSPPSPGHLRCSAAPPAPVGPGSLVSTHTGHKHCWLPSGAARWHGQVQIRTILWIHAVAAEGIKQQTFFFFYMLPSQLSGRRLPSSSASVLESRYRAADVPAGAFEGFHEKP